MNEFPETDSREQQTRTRRSKNPIAESALEGFDYAVDVLIVGFGCAGAAAAFEAARSGASVLIIERAGGAGGASAQSGGELYLGGGTSVQKACGFDDDADSMFTYLQAALGPHVDEEKLRVYCDESVEHFNWLCDRGLEFNASFYDKPSFIPPTDDGLMWLGENAWPYDQIARPAPRGHRPAAESFGGWMLMDKLATAASELGVQSHTDTLATNLVVDETGRVTGVVARRYGKQVTYAARSVILTTGGFVDNEEMLAAHALELVGHGKVSNGLDDGSGIEMALALGAAARRMSIAVLAMMVVPALAARGILVNAHGQRFINEDVYPGLFSVEAALHQPSPHWLIVDEQGYEQVPEAERLGSRPAYAAETLAELEVELGMPAGALENTVSTYNRYAVEGRDPYFHKATRWLRPLAGPFAALDPRQGFQIDGYDSSGTGTGVSGFTLGGLVTSIDGEVLDLSGERIPGLYSAGRASAGIHGEGYISGTSLGDGTFFGRKAGRAAAAASRRTDQGQVLGTTLVPDGPPPTSTESGTSSSPQCGKIEGMR